MREIVHLQAGQCGNQIGAKVSCRSASHQIAFYERVSGSTVNTVRVAGVCGYNCHF